MTSKSITLLLCACVAIAVSAFFLLSKTPTKTYSSTIVVGTESNYPPFEFMQDSQLVGFEIDLVREIAKRLEMQVEFKDMAFDNLLLAAQNGSIDVIAAALTPTPERMEQVLFCDVHMQNSLALVSLQASALTSLDELRGKTVILNDGFATEKSLSLSATTNTLKIPTIIEAILALKSGRADAYIVSSAAVKRYVGPELSLHDLGIEESMAFGIAKTREDLVEKFNKTLTEMSSDGSLEALKRKWLG